MHFHKKVYLANDIYAIIDDDTYTTDVYYLYSQTVMFVIIVLKFIDLKLTTSLQKSRDMVSIQSDDNGLSLIFNKQH